MSKPYLLCTISKSDLWGGGCVFIANPAPVWFTLANITDYWQEKLRAHCVNLKSLKYFKPQYMSLTKPHPILLHAKTSYDTNRIITVCRMISGRFRCGSLTKHFSDHGTDLCELCGDAAEDLAHILVPHCVHLLDRADMLLRFATDTLSSCTQASILFFDIIHSKDDNLKVQLLLDPTVIPSIISANQLDKTIFPLMLRVTTTWCYSMNRRRIKLLGK